MTIVNTAIPVTGAQLVRPLAVMPNGAAMAPTTMPISPLVPSPMLTAGAAMDPVSFQTWWNAVSQLNGSRPGTPLAALNPGPFARMGSPTLEQMQEFQQQHHQAQQQRQQQQAGGAAAKGRGGARSGKGKGGSGRSPSPGILADGTQANGQAGLPLKASRHKYAEQRRRNRINERLDSLRLLVPHTEGSNIAGFLDQVIEYVTKLQHKLKIKPREDVEGEGPAADVSRGVARALVEGKQKADAAAEEENQQVKREASDEGEADRPAKKVKRDS